MVFREVQYFWLNRASVAVSVAVALVGVAVAVLPGSEQGRAGGAWVVYAGVVVPLLLPMVSLKTEVTSNGVVHVGFHPFRRGRRVIRRRDIERAEAQTFNAGEVSGYGFRIGPGGVQAYRVAGKRGVLLSLVGGKTILFGSQRPEDLADAINGLGAPAEQAPTP